MWRRWFCRRWGCSSGSRSRGCGYNLPHLLHDFLADLVVYEGKYVLGGIALEGAGDGQGLGLVAVDVEVGHYRAVSYVAVIGFRRRNAGAVLVYEMDFVGYGITKHAVGYYVVLVAFDNEGRACAGIGSVVVFAALADSADVIFVV